MIRTFLMFATAVCSAAAIAHADEAGPAASAPSAAPAASQPIITPAGLSDDLTVWPNKVSFRNSDDWLWQNHDKIRKLRPRVLVLNFANDADMTQIREHVEALIAALRESSRYHGYKDPDAPVFLEYEVARYVDLRDDPIPEDQKDKCSSKMPTKKNWRSRDVMLDYAGLYTDEFAKNYGCADPRTPGRFLNLHELINSGLVHELWFYAVHRGPWPGLETCEFKQYYDMECKPIAGKSGPAGNGHDKTMPWSGRSFRIAFFNPHRGIGCCLENFAHSLEWTATTDSIAYFGKYGREYMELDLDKRRGFPFHSLYNGGPDDRVEYPDKSMVIHRGDKSYTVKPYVNFGGNAHFPPGGRRDYDLDSPFTVDSVIENYRLRNGPDGKDLVTEFNIDKVSRYKDLAPDCMGRWLVYWRQNMPGLDNKAVDDEGKPMKNWWPFLFY